jgi:hypothetical protein
VPGGAAADAGFAGVCDADAIRLIATMSSLNAMSFLLVWQRWHAPWIDDDRPGPEPRRASSLRRWLEITT